MFQHEKILMTQYYFMGENNINEIEKFHLLEQNQRENLLLN